MRVLSLHIATGDIAQAVGPHCVSRGHHGPSRVLAHSGDHRRHLLIEKQRHLHAFILHHIRWECTPQQTHRAQNLAFPNNPWQCCQLRMWQCTDSVCRMIHHQEYSPSWTLQEHSTVSGARGLSDLAQAPHSRNALVPCSCSCGSVGWHTTSWIVLMRLVPLIMLLMMHRLHLHQPWRLDGCEPFMHGWTSAPVLSSNQP